MDNLDQQVRRERRVGSPEGTLVSLDETLIDARQRPVQSRVYAVNPVTGIANGAFLTGRTVYSPRGEIIRSVEPGGGKAFKVRAYDAAGRLVDDSQVVSNPQIPGEDLVVESRTHTLDAVGRTLGTTLRQLDTGTDPTAPTYRDSYTQDWHDGIGRLIATAERGAALSAPSRPGVPPATDSTTLVSTFVYDTAGYRIESASPAGKVTRESFDPRGRMIREDRRTTSRPARPIPPRPT